MCGQRLLQNYECLANAVLLTNKVEYTNAEEGTVSEYIVSE